MASSEVERARALVALHASLGGAEDDLPSLLRRASEAAAELLGDAAAIWTVGSGGQASLRTVAHRDAAALTVMERAAALVEGNPQSLIGAAIEHGATIRLAPDEVAALGPHLNPAYRPYFDDIGLSSMVIVPLVNRGRRIGALGVARNLERVALDDDEVAFLEQVAKVIALTVANAQLFEQIDRDQQRASQLAREDALTGLLNRRGFLEALHAQLAEPRTGGALVAVLDMDGFKLVNDGFGHAAGDLVLAGMAARLCAAVPRSTPVARIGGDEFALLVMAEDDEQAAEIVEDAVRACTGFVDVVGLHVPITVSVGTSVPTLGDGESALHQADLAMNRAKRRGGVTTAYDARLDDPATRRLRDVLSLREAITGDDLVVLYQPVVAVGGGPLRVEALVRRRVGDLLLPPSAWLDLADRAGLMPELTANVVHQVVTQLGLWWRAGFEVECAVNVPAPVLAAPDLVKALLRLLDQAGLPRRALSVEVTEGDLVGPNAKAALARCADADIAVAVDDFGTGWSALSYLVDLPLTTLKIDRTFVEGIDTDSRRGAIVQAVVVVAHQLGLRVVAEGVETPAVADALIDLGVDALQGYLFARPVPASELEVLMRGGLVASHR